MTHVGKLVTVAWMCLLVSAGHAQQMPQQQQQHYAQHVLPQKAIVHQDDTDDSLDASYFEHRARSPLLYRVSSTYGDEVQQGEEQSTLEVNKLRHRPLDELLLSIVLLFLLRCM